MDEQEVVPLMSLLPYVMSSHSIDPMLVLQPLFPVEALLQSGMDNGAFPQVFLKTGTVQQDVVGEGSGVSN